MPDFGDHTVFIYTAYAVSLLVLAGLIFYTIQGRRRGE